MKHIFIWVALFITTTAFSQEATKGKLVYSNNLSNEKQLKGWVLEGKANVEFKDGWMHLYSPNEENHHVYWCPENFPANFIAEWDAQNFKIDAGLCIIFFCAKGVNGEDIFDLSMPKRTTGNFDDYTKGVVNCYHISYYANGRDRPGRLIANLRKNTGFHLIESSEPGIPISYEGVNHLKLVKNGASIQMFVDGRKMIDWVDNGKQFGPVLGEGKIGFRQMEWTHFAYRNFKVWQIANANFVPEK